MPVRLSNTDISKDDYDAELHKRHLLTPEG